MTTSLFQFREVEKFGNDVLQPLNLIDYYPQIILLRLLNGARFSGQQP